MEYKNTILLVDDRPENLLTLESILSEPHRTFLSATSGAEALLMCNLEKIDLILLDYRLDDMNGMEVIRELRKNNPTAHIPVILVTALSKRESPVLDEFEPGTVDILHKPLDMFEARKKVDLYEDVIQFRKTSM
ncbi:MAG: response regulator [Bacteroidia bacterium]